MSFVYVVEGFDVGGNSGNVVMAVFDDEAEANRYANDPANFKWNHAMWPEEGKVPFDVTSMELWTSVEDFLLDSRAASESP